MKAAPTALRRQNEPTPVDWPEAEQERKRRSTVLAALEGAMTAYRARVDELDRVLAIARNGSTLSERAIALSELSELLSDEMQISDDEAHYVQYHCALDLAADRVAARATVERVILPCRDDADKFARSHVLEGVFRELGVPLDPIVDAIWDSAESVQQKRREVMGEIAKGRKTLIARVEEDDA